MSVPHEPVHTGLGWLDLGVSTDVIAQDDGFGNFLHRFAFLAALALQGKVSLLFVETQIALQNSFGALDDFSGL